MVQKVLTKFVEAREVRAPYSEWVSGVRVVLCEGDFLEKCLA